MKVIKNRLGQDELQPPEYVPPGPASVRKVPIPAQLSKEDRTTSKCPHCGKDIEAPVG